MGRASPPESESFGLDWHALGALALLLVLAVWWVRFHGAMWLWMHCGVCSGWLLAAGGVVFVPGRSDRVLYAVVGA